MTIAKASILSAVNSRCSRDLTEIDQILTSILTDISLSGEFIRETATLSLLAGATSIALAADFRTVVSIPGLSEKPIAEVHNDLALLGEGVPDHYAIFDRTLHLNRSLAAATDYTIYYSAIDGDPDAIVLDDIFTECIIEGCCFKLLEGLDLTADAATHKTLYDEQLAKLAAVYK